MSKRKNGTYRAASALGINPYGRRNGKARKKPREVRTRSGNYEKIIQHNNSTETVKNQEGDENEISL